MKRFPSRHDKVVRLLDGVVSERVIKGSLITWGVVKSAEEQVFDHHLDDYFREFNPDTIEKN